MKKYVIGHKNPDTDSVISSIAFSFYLKKGGIDAEPIIPGKINRETEFILKYLKIKIPKLFKKAPINSGFYLVDHSGLGRSILGMKEDSILGVVDHHKMGGLNTIVPILYRCETVGSTSTVITKMFKEKNWIIDKKIASLLLSGIISDTLNLTSVTTTDDDRKILRELALKSGVDVKKFSQQMFEAKSDISGMGLKKILLSDYKEYVHNKKKIGMGVWETVVTEVFNKKEEDILKTLRKIKIEKKLDFLFFGLVNIFKKNTIFYIIDDSEFLVAKKAFKLKNKKLQNTILMKGVTSRKKQILPFILKSI